MLKKTFILFFKLYIYWAIPSNQCLNKTNPSLEPQIFGIKTNKEQKFHGTEIVIFYEQQLGLYPYLEFNEEINNLNNNNTIKYINGGLPQNVNLNEHLEKAKNDILKAIPDPEFSGPAIIDYEKWRPEWSLNWSIRRIYQLESIKEIIKIYPGRKLRPKALWGFYDTPLCNYDAGEQLPYGCLEMFRKHNDKLWWLYAEVSSLYSSIYLYPDDRKRKKVLCERHMHAKIAEAEWIWSLRRKDHPYNNSQNLFYSKEELFCSYEWTAQLGVDALIIWSSSKQIKKRCQPISIYLNKIFGPFVQKLLENTEEFSCSKRICHGRGRCILRDRRRHHKPWHGEHWPRKQFTCICQRNETFYGEYCDLSDFKENKKENNRKNILNK
ncbi:Hyaluronidase [Meloidogyne graminicola]|uniref:Hyaluronidase n=1 Tax=Meloidogyne graminicola TaxID=189291 RepID=A0A8S9Z6X6_9BILA|nr:Hyaluronidase [Meloidogyne graminicola]